MPSPLLFDVTGAPPAQEEIDRVRAELYRESRRLFSRNIYIWLIALPCSGFVVTLVATGLVTGHIEFRAVLLGVWVLLVSWIVVLSPLRDAFITRRTSLDDHGDALRPLTSIDATTVLALISAHDTLRCYQHAVAALRRDLTIAEVHAMLTWAARQQRALLDAQGELDLRQLRLPV